MQAAFERYIEKITPRVLTQICRDSNSRFYGACDRNWWHYKIRDFPSIILQQAGLYLLEASKLELFAEQRNAFREYARATLEFWIKRARKYGAFEEYYPWEDSYPALAFSSLAMFKVARELRCDIPHKVLRMISRKLHSRNEYEASNQYMAGIAALFYLHELAPELAPLELVKDKLFALLDAQDEEGWFNEYGGADLGYLSVTIDCLWDIYDLFPDARVKDAISRAVAFIDHATIEGRSIGLHNSRNTDYILPYGILRGETACWIRHVPVSRSIDEKGCWIRHVPVSSNSIANEDVCNPPLPVSSISSASKNIVTEDSVHDSEEQQFIAHESIAFRLFSCLDDPSHFAYAIDDRYLCHYAGLSFVRAAELLERCEPGCWIRHVPVSRNSNANGDVCNPPVPVSRNSNANGDVCNPPVPVSSNSNANGDVCNPPVPVSRSPNEKGCWIRHVPVSSAPNTNEDVCNPPYLDGECTLRSKPTRDLRLKTHGKATPFLILHCGQTRLLISTQKGGNITFIHPKGRFTDYGWLHPAPQGKLYVSNFMGASELISQNGNTYTLRLGMFPAGEQPSNPFLHFLLRLAGFFLGRRIISFLKARMIFGKKRAKYYVSREITLHEKGLDVRDIFPKELPKGEPIRASAFSRRHVASADSFNPDNIRLYEGCEVSYSTKVTSDAREELTHVCF